MYAVGAKKIEIFIRDQPAKFGLRDHECPNTLPVPSPYLALNENFFSSTTVSTIDLPSNFYSESSNNSASSAHWHSVQPLPFPLFIPKAIFGPYGVCMIPIGNAGDALIPDPELDAGDELLELLELSVVARCTACA